MIMVRGTLITFFLWCMFLFMTGDASAQAPCGSIIQPSNWSDPNSSLVTSSITECDDPFNLTTSVASPYALFINGAEVIPGSEIEVPSGGVNTYRIEGDPLLSGYNGYFFLHDGDDYRYINTAPPPPGEEEYRALAQLFFSEGTDIEPYIETILSGDYFLDDPAMQEQLFAFVDYVEREYEPVTPSLGVGTYTLVLREYEFILTDAGETLIERLRSLVLPVAHAQVPYREYIFAITFTLTEAHEPQGVSNILFLPGMQGSRLYTKDGDGSEKQLWEPFGKEDYEDLRMTGDGVSVNDVYTRDIVDEIYGVAGNIYKTFVQFLRDMDGPVSGPLVETFPYDWREDVFDVVQNGVRLENGSYTKPTTTVAFLAGTSPTGKVTLIAHSNGGLLAKALMRELEAEGKENLVDKIIFIATPHIGTPKAIAALLHGYDQETAFNIPADARDIRAVIKNMPGPYSLLPSESYIDSLTEPLISFDGSSTTKLYRDRYGFTVSTMAEYRDFLSGAEGREEVLDEIALPTKTNSVILDDALQAHATMLDDWDAPEGIEVFNIVGTGLKTLKSIEYREFVMDYCGSLACIIKKIEPVVQFTSRGDETVVTRSAKSTSYDTQLFLNMDEINDIKHANITESEAVQILVDRIVHGSSTDDISNVTITEPDFENNLTLVDKIHSPARIFIEDKNGRRTGRDSASAEWKEEIPGTNYYEIGGVKYILKPADFDHKVVIEGEGLGVFTHVIDELNDDVQETLHTIVATVTPTTRITYAYTNGTTSPVSVDQNGDGIVEYQLTIDGVLIDTKAAYSELRATIRNLKLPRLKEVILIGIVDQAEQFFKKRSDTRSGRTFEKLEEGALYLLDQTLVQLRKAKLITPEAYQGVKGIIDKLIKQ
jgi:Lecithin:cholesterol acyltransferase